MKQYTAYILVTEDGSDRYVKFSQRTTHTGTHRDIDFSKFIEEATILHGPIGLRNQELIEEQAGCKIRYIEVLVKMEVIPRMA